MSRDNRISVTSIASDNSSITYRVQNKKLASLPEASLNARKKLTSTLTQKNLIQSALENNARLAVSNKKMADLNPGRTYSEDAGSVVSLDTRQILERKRSASAEVTVDSFNANRLEEISTKAKKTNWNNNFNRKFNIGSKNFYLKKGFFLFTTFLSFNKLSPCNL